MGKSDKRRAQGKIDEQQKLAQGYLTGLQGQLAGQYGGYSNAMFGSTPSATNNTYGWGTTTPHYSWTNQGYFPGSTTGNNAPFDPNAGGRTAPPGSQTGGYAIPRGGGVYNPPGAPTGDTRIAGGQPQTLQTAQVQPRLASILQGEASPARLQQLMPQIQQAFPGTFLEDSDEIVIPGYGRIDVGGNFEGGGPMRWTFQSQADNLARGIDNSRAVGGFGGGIMGRTLGDYDSIMRQYQNWANTGGMTEMDKANLRGRAISPIRSMYSNAQREIGRTRGLQGGYSPGHTAALTRLNRDFGQNASDATLNAEAAITDMMLRGKQFGMGGMSGMYGQTPGLASTFGNQMLASMGQQLQAGGLQNQLANMLIGGQTQEGMMQGFPWAEFLKGLGSLAGGVGAL
jgi:hypothetical protein